jgi:hypothetical protein
LPYEPFALNAPTGNRWQQERAVMQELLRMEAAGESATLVRTI